MFIKRNDYINKNGTSTVEPLDIRASINSERERL